jgi:hypothetical protein
MGCGSTKVATSTTRTTISYDARMAVPDVQRTWPNIKRIENLGPKTFAQ